MGIGFYGKMPTETERQLHVAEREIIRLDREAADIAFACRIWFGLALGGWAVAVAMVGFRVYEGMAR